jgi:hypothetical protein
MPQQRRNDRRLEQVPRSWIEFDDSNFFDIP